MLENKSVLALAYNRIMVWLETFQPMFVFRNRQPIIVAENRLSCYYFVFLIQWPKMKSQKEA